ncbi:PREDICTED: phospholipase A(1) DAD1, chloroplastic-like [Nelumbo nucifera]|nr:PREDICTED: phospholipase A(1) DAD1, chloroplastic-like [Nelumbo nucifera]
MEYQGIKNWEGLLDPLDDNLRGEIIRYGKFVEAAYSSFEFDTSSPSYATCRFSTHSLLKNSGVSNTGYRVTKNLTATSGIKFPRWVEKAPSWVWNQSSWVGYVAICDDKDEIARLGRRDVVIAYRGTATCMEWLENLRATLTHLPNAPSNVGPDIGGPMVEKGFLSLYTSETATCRSLRDEVKEEVGRILQRYGDEPLSLTITGHSLGAALATLTAYDITTTFNSPAPLVTVISFGTPRVGNRSFSCHVERCGTKILRIVNSHDLITKVPGFVIDGHDHHGELDSEEVGKRRKGAAGMAAGLPSWLQKRVEETQWVYADVGRELRVSSGDSSYLTWPITNVVTHHDLDTYLQLVSGYVSSKCPLRDTAKRVLSGRRAEKCQTQNKIRKLGG